MSIVGFWRDVRWQAMGNTAAQVIGILGLPLLTRLYSPSDLAAQAVFLQFAMFFAGVMTLRFEYFVQLPKTDLHALALVRWTVALALLGMLICTPLVLALIPWWIATHQGPAGSGPQAWAGWLSLAPLTAALISVSLALQHLVQRRGQFIASGLGEVAAKGGFISFGAGAALLNAGTLGLVLTTAFGCLAKLLVLRQTQSFRWADALPPLSRERAAWRPLVDMARTHRHLSLSMVASHLSGTVTGLAPILYIVQFHGDESLGQFNLVTMTIFLPASLIGTAIGQVYYQRAAKLWAEGLPFDALWRQTALHLLLIGAPVYLLIALLSPWAYPLLFGAQWTAAGELAPWMAIPAFCAFLSTPLERSCLVTGRWKYQMAWHGLRALTTLGLVAVSAHLGLEFVRFLQLLVVQMSAMYMIDLAMEHRFSRLQPNA